MLESQIFYPQLEAEQDFNRWLEKEKQVRKKKEKKKDQNERLLVF